MEIFLWRIGTGMNFIISEFSDGNISQEDCENFIIIEVTDCMPHYSNLSRFNPIFSQQVLIQSVFFPSRFF